MIDVRNAAQRDMIGGAGVLLLGLGTSGYAALRYPFGTLQRMDSGMFPFMLGLILVLLGGILLISAIKSIRRQERCVVELRFETRPFFSVLSAVLAFAILARPFGLVPAIVVTIIVATATDRNIKPVETAVLCVVLTVLAVVVFKILLGLQFILFRWPF